MSKVYTSAVVIIPPKEIWAPIQEIRRRYDRQVNRWMPHITLIYPFRPELEFDALEEQFSEICKNIEPFEITLNSFNYFTHRHQNFTIWLNPEPRDLLIKLQNKIQSIVPDCNEVSIHKGGFIPHLSVGQIKNKTELTRTLQILADKWNTPKFTLIKIHFIARENNKASKFKIKKIIKF